MAFGSSGFILRFYVASLFRVCFDFLFPFVSSLHRVGPQLLDWKGLLSVPFMSCLATNMAQLNALDLLQMGQQRVATRGMLSRKSGRPVSLPELDENWIATPK
ncbi:hypothetical protein Salat_1731600 [Sesamum alatum]|uniref:Uncharacterized protein n=1 Tax=Sesamum alatum TaxID=300844 RepID=A0AAE2CKD3_9LAMI|nr:hypothetical protein Salat_1731600 [Sesamum alatum]